MTFIFFLANTKSPDIRVWAFCNFYSSYFVGTDHKNLPIRSSTLSFSCKPE